MGRNTYFFYVNFLGRSGKNAKKCNAIVYGMDMQGKTYIEDYKQEGNIVTYKRTGTNNEFYDKTFNESYDIAKMLYPNATITKK